MKSLILLSSMWLLQLEIKPQAFNESLSCCTIKFIPLACGRSQSAAEFSLAWELRRNTNKIKRSLRPEWQQGWQVGRDTQIHTHTSLSWLVKWDFFLSLVVYLLACEDTFTVKLTLLFNISKENEILYLHLKHNNHQNVCLDQGRIRSFWMMA